MKVNTPQDRQDTGMTTEIAMDYQITINCSVICLSHGAMVDVAIHLGGLVPW